MKLSEALEIGEACGLHTIEECVLNIELHGTAMFTYEQLHKELEELYQDLKEYKNGIN